jgi:hypothetical protein
VHRSADPAVLLGRNSVPAFPVRKECNRIDSHQHDMVICGGVRFAKQIQPQHENDMVGLR